MTGTASDRARLLLPYQTRYHRIGKLSSVIKKNTASGYKPLDKILNSFNREIKDCNFNRNFFNLHNKQQMQRRNSMLIKESFMFDDDTVIKLWDGTVLTEGKVYEAAKEARRIITEQKGHGLPKHMGEMAKVLSFDESVMLCNVRVNENASLIEVSSWVEEDICYCECIPQRIRQIVQEHTTLKRGSRVESIPVQESVDLPQDVQDQINGLQEEYNEYVQERNSLGLSDIREQPTIPERPSRFDN